jgi:hypothetical protein
MPVGSQSRPIESADKRLEQISRVVRSPVLQGSEALCSLLKFLAERSFSTPDVPIKEYQIATEVFGRPPNFDPRLDSAVRVQMSRLRAKLSEYYNGVGRSDPILVEIPKGSHTVVFTERDSTAATPGADTVTRTAAVEPAPVVRSNLWKWSAAGLAAVVLAGIAASQLGNWGKPVAGASDRAARSRNAAETFWRSFLQSAEEPLVVFSNAEFVGRPETGLRYFSPARDRAELVFDHYTGVGEVTSVHELDQMFGQLGRKSRVKRGRLLNWDDGKNREVVFLGSPSENLSLRELSLSREFRFETMKTPPRAGDLGIVNLHPVAGEEPVYFGSKELPITEDYALVEMSAANGTARSVLMLAGTTTFGTQAAVEFMCDEERVNQLLPKLRGDSGHLVPFTALLRVKVQRGVPVETSLVALRRNPASP